MANTIVRGKYTANIIDYGIGQTKDGNPQVMILLNYLDQDNDSHEITWFGSLKEGKSQEITVETLLKCGLKGNDLNSLDEGVPSDLLDVITPVTIAVIEHEYQGKKSMRVQWIGKGSAGALDKKLTPNEARVKIGALNLKATVLAMRQETGIKDEPRKQMSSHISAPMTEDDLPF